MKTITLKEQIEKQVRKDVENLMGLDFNEELRDVLNNKEAIASYHTISVKFYTDLKEAGKITNFIVNPDRSISYE